jgi:hypothetical protein
VDVVGREAHRRQVQATPAGGSVEQVARRSASRSNRSE